MPRRLEQELLSDFDLCNVMLGRVCVCVRAHMLTVVGGAGLSGGLVM